MKNNQKSIYNNTSVLPIGSDLLKKKKWKLTNIATKIHNSYITHDVIP